MLAPLDNSASVVLGQSKPYIPGVPYQYGDGLTLDHINQAQTALQNKDIEGSNNHLELAKQSLQGNQSNQGQ